MSEEVRLPFPSPALAPFEEDQFRVQLDLFEGPLDLLLFLIRKNELEITELALGRITAQYLDYLQLFETLNISVAGEYLVHAATLVELKSRMLLRPQEEATTDSAEDLIQKLREREHLQIMAQSLSELQEQAIQVWVRQDTEFQELREWVVDATPMQLCYALEELVRSIQNAPVHEVRFEDWSVPDKIQQLTGELELRHRVLLNRLLEGSVSRGEAVAYLLAALEMCKQIGPLRVLQPMLFGDIELVMEEA